MIGLATHERRVHLLREWVPIGRQRFIEMCDMCGKEGHLAKACPLLQAARAAQTSTQAAASLASKFVEKPLLLLSLPTLREYLLHSLRPEALSQPLPTERAALASAVAARRRRSGARGSTG